MDKNIYVPTVATIKHIRPETLDTSTFTVIFEDGEIFDYKPGQFAEISVFGVGECPISISSTPSRKGYLEFCVRDTGWVTNALHNLDVGDKIGVRGPYGKPFPLKEAEGKDILFVAGGIGLAPLRSLINYMLDNRDVFGKIEIIYGARTPKELCFKRELKIWEGCENIAVYLTVDRADGMEWNGKVGFVPDYLKELNPPPENRIVFVCGPPIMISIVLKDLTKMGYGDSQVVTTLERKMKCGVGKCGRCNIGEKYVCQDGPVFTLAELKELKEFPIE